MEEPCEIKFETKCIKNKCEVCGKNAFFNYPDKDYGIRCTKDKLMNMKNLFTPQFGEQRFINSINKLGGKVIGKYTGSGNIVECICPNNHKCNPRPDSIRDGRGMCRVCVNNDPKTAENNFFENIKLLGGKVVGKYTGKDNFVNCLCPLGHKCNPRPNSIRNGQGMCRVCANQDPETAKNNFFKNIELLGGKVIGKYTSSVNIVECICSNNHKCNPRPNSIQQGKGMCLICVGLDPKTAENNFFENIEKLGGKVIGKYTRAVDNVECVCPNGHKCNPIPNNIQQGGGMCGICKNKTEEKILKQCQTLTITEKDFRPDWCSNPVTNRHLPFDILLSKYKLIIECDGVHHFKDKSNWYSLSSDVQSRDIYKMERALSNGYSILRLHQEDVYSDKIDWKKSITNCISSLELDPTPKIWMNAKNMSVYDNHHIVLIGDENLHFEELDDEEEDEIEV